MLQIYSASIWGCPNIPPWALPMPSSDIHQTPEWALCTRNRGEVDRDSVMHLLPAQMYKQQLPELTMKPEELHRFGNLHSAGIFCPLPFRLQ